MADTSIEWTEKVWNPVRGCSKVSAGCENCYAMKQARRFNGSGKPYEGLTKMVKGKGPQWTGEVRCVEEMLDRPLRRRKPAKVFVNSMSDLFHPDVPFEFVDRVFTVMALCPHHTFQVLTKRPERMREYLTHEDVKVGICEAAEKNPAWRGRTSLPVGDVRLPLRNVWLGTSVENQPTADERIPHLLQTPAAVRWLSMEPLLGPVDFYRSGSLGAEYGDPCAFSALTGTDVCDPPIPGIDWVIVGGESGSRARPMDLAWPREIVAQCKAAGVPVFVKQLGAAPYEIAMRLGRGYDPDDLMKTMQNGRGVPDGWTRVVTEGSDELMRYHRFKSKKGSDPSEWPEDLRVQEYPAAPPEGASDG